MPHPHVQRVGFVILSHQNPRYLRRLTTRLVEGFDGCTVVCHHDFERCPIAPEELPSDVSFVQKPIRTFWGHISLIHAELAALKLLYEMADPDWFFILSGSDYPLMSSRHILEELAQSDFDGYLDHKTIPHRRANKKLLWPAYRPKDWIGIARHRYIETTLSPAVLGRLSSQDNLADIDEYVREKKEMILVESQRRFPAKLQCFAGDHWLTGNRKIATLLLSDGGIRDVILDYFAVRAIPDEAVYQTILCNAHGITVSAASRRYADWSDNTGHPKVLGVSDLDSMMRSRSHFGRKFDGSIEVLDAIDQAVLCK